MEKNVMSRVGTLCTIVVLMILSGLLAASVALAVFDDKSCEVISEDLPSNE